MNAKDEKKVSRRFVIEGGKARARDLTRKKGAFKVGRNEFVQRIITILIGDRSDMRLSDSFPARIFFDELRISFGVERL